MESKYYDKIIDGYLCTFDSDNHICIGVMLATGMKIEEWQKFKEKMVGKTDPEFNLTTITNHSVNS